jgi:hypothetical protein
VLQTKGAEPFTGRSTGFSLRWSSELYMVKRKFQIGDKVKVVGMSQVTFAPGVKDDSELKNYSKACSARSIPFGDLTNTEMSNLNRNG